MTDCRGREENRGEGRERERGNRKEGRVRERGREWGEGAEEHREREREQR